MGGAAQRRAPPRLPHGDRGRGARQLKPIEPKPINRTGRRNQLRNIANQPPLSLARRLNSHSARDNSCSTSRGFLPWRLSDDGPRCKWKSRDGAVMRNPYNNSGRPFDGGEHGVMLK